MTRRSICQLALAALLGSLLTIPTASADWTCNGVLIEAAADAGTGPGRSCGNDYQATQTSNDVRQCLQETMQGGNSKLSHTWRFDNVPPGPMYFIREGYRPNNLDGDSFRLSPYYYTEEGPFFFLLPSAKISKALELQGGEKFDMNFTNDATRTFHVLLQDVGNVGNDLAKVYIDYLALCVDPVEPLE